MLFMTNSYLLGGKNKSLYKQNPGQIKSPNVNKNGNIALVILFC